MELKHKLYSIDEAAELLSIPVQEVHRLAEENELSKVPAAITVASVLEFATRKGIALKQGITGR